MFISKMGWAKNQSKNYEYQTWSQFSNANTNKICQNHATLENLKKKYQNLVSDNGITAYLYVTK